MKQVKSNKAYFEFSWEPFGEGRLKSKTIIVSKKPTWGEKRKYFDTICWALSKVENKSRALIHSQEYTDGYIDLAWKDDFKYELYGQIYIGPLRV